MKRSRIKLWDEFGTPIIDVDAEDIDKAKSIFDKIFKKKLK